MVNRVVVPTLLVAVMWIIVSLGTTIYVFWLDDSYQRDFQQHVRCTDTAGALLEQLWRLQADLDDTSLEPVAWRLRVRHAVEKMEQDMRTIASATGSSEHARLLGELQELATSYWQILLGLDGPPVNLQSESVLRLPAELLAERVNQLRELHHKLMREAATSRDSISTVVLWVRGLVLFVGPLLGWWMANRLGRVVNEIRVTLESSADLYRDEVGAIQFRTGDDLSLIRQQVDLIVERLRMTAEELKRANHEVLRSDRLAAIGRLAAGIAHELRNPMTSVKLLIQYAIEPGNQNLTREQFQLLLGEIERMEATIQGLLDLSRAEPMQRTRGDLRETFARAAQLISGRAVRQQIDAQLDTGAEPLMLDGDFQQLHQVCINLCLNAIESMPEGGVLLIRARNLTDPAVIRVEVQDTGPGIREDILPRLFEPFVTSKERGTGLGLAISRRIIETHGGIISATNLPIRGALFTIDIPQTVESRSQPSPVL